jgi:hypothetical protein
MNMLCLDTDLLDAADRQPLTDLLAAFLANAYVLYLLTLPESPTNDYHTSFAFVPQCLNDFVHAHVVHSDFLFAAGYNEFILTMTPMA